MIATQTVIGLMMVFLVDSTDPNLGAHALGLYFLALLIDVVIGGLKR
jgi:hypothetical protein